MAKWQNREKALAFLKRLPAVMKAEVQAQGDIEVKNLAEAIARAAPVSDLDPHPGALRESVEGVRDTRQELKWRVNVTARDAKGRFIAKHVEFGHMAKDGTHVPAVPFAYPTARAAASGIKRRLSAAGRRGAKKAALGTPWTAS